MNRVERVAMQECAMASGIHEHNSIASDVEHWQNAAHNARPHAHLNESINMHVGGPAVLDVVMQAGL